MAYKTGIVGHAAKLRAMIGRCDGWMGLITRPLVLQFADDHHASHEDAKPGDLSLQLPSRSRSSVNQFSTRMNRSDSETLDASRSSQIHEYFQSCLPSCESQDQTTGFRHC